MSKRIPAPALKSTKHRRQSTTLARKTTEAAISSPQVIRHRLTRMALAGANPGNRDKKEFHGMITEKYVGFTKAWFAMGVATIRANLVISGFMVTGFFNPFSRNKFSVFALAGKVQEESMNVLNKGLTPLHKKVVSNSKRLAKSTSASKSRSKSHKSPFNSH